MATRIDLIDKQLSAWVSEVLGVAPGTLKVSLSPPAPQIAEAGSGVNLYLFELRHAPPLRTQKRPPLQMQLLYLVSTWAQSEKEAHRLLGELAFAVMAHPDYEAEFAQVPAETWAGFGIPPRPSFFVSVPIRREQLDTAVPPVREPHAVIPADLVTLTGQVLGPHDIPFPGVRLTMLPNVGAQANGEITPESMSGNASTTTDVNGRFAFKAVPRKTEYKLFVRAKGHEMIITFAALQKNEPLIIRFVQLTGRVTGLDAAAHNGLHVLAGAKEDIFSGAPISLPAGEQPLPDIGLTYPALQFSAPLTRAGEFFLLLHEKLRGHEADVWSRMAFAVLDGQGRRIENVQVEHPTVIMEV